MLMRLEEHQKTDLCHGAFRNTKRQKAFNRRSFEKQYND